MSRLWDASSTSTRSGRAPSRSSSRRERRWLTCAGTRQGEIVHLGPTRLSAVETVHAMTVHKTQGSQFDTVAVILPEPESPILTRELLYTSVTRAQTHLTVVGSEAA